MKEICPKRAAVKRAIEERRRKLLEVRRAKLLEEARLHPEKVVWDPNEGPSIKTDELRKRRRQGKEEALMAREAMMEALLLAKKVQVMSEWETLDQLRKGKSISRYGDGELKHMNGRRNVSQVFHESLQNRLIEVYQSRLPNHMVAIPNVFNGRQFTEVSEDYIVSMRRKFRKISDPNYVYGSSYITRGDLNGYMAWPVYWFSFFSIWEDRDITLVRGHEKRANPTMMKNARSIHQIPILSVGAWKDYKSILRECMERPSEDVFLICAGPTATVLAYDLAKEGRQAIDLGHLGLFYKRNWGVEYDEEPQVWHHRPSDPGYVKGVTDV